MKGKLNFVGLMFFSIRCSLDKIVIILMRKDDSSTLFEWVTHLNDSSEYLEITETGETFHTIAAPVAATCTKVEYPGTLLHLFKAVFTPTLYNDITATFVTKPLQKACVSTFYF